jgi:alanyl-tRNA synthetase
LFGEKYGDEVRVVSVGDWAKELCGGTHVTRSGQLGVVKLLSESSIGAGVRRVEALVGHDAYKYLAREHILLNSLTEIIKGSRTEELPERISDLIEKLKVMEKELSGVRVATAISNSADLFKNAKKIGSSTLITSMMPNGLAGDELRAVALSLKSKAEGSIIVLSSILDGKVNLISAVSTEAIALGVKAGELIKIGSAVLGGGGGGKDDFAQGGGTSLDKVAEAFSEIEKTIISKLK